MNIFNGVLNFIFDMVLYPFKGIDPLWGIIFISVVVGILMLIIFKHTSDQAGIKNQKNQLKAHFLEFRLYHDDIGLSFEAIKNVFLINFKYLKFSIKPMLILMWPVIIIVIQLASRYEYRPLKVGESAILSVKLANNSHLTENLINVPETILIETPPLRILEKNQIDWRIKALQVGHFNIVVQLGNKKYNKLLSVGSKFEKLASYRVAGFSLTGLLNPAETSLPSDSFIKEIRIRYPKRELSIWGWQIHWLVIFFVVSVGTSFAMKNVFKVQV